MISGPVISSAAGNAGFVNYRVSTASKLTPGNVLRPDAASAWRRLQAEGTLIGAFWKGLAGGADYERAADVLKKAKASRRQDAAFALFEKALAENVLAMHPSYSRGYCRSHCEYILKELVPEEFLERARVLLIRRKDREKMIPKPEFFPDSQEGWYFHMAVGIEGRVYDLDFAGRMGIGVRQYADAMFSDLSPIRAISIPAARYLQDLRHESEKDNIFSSPNEVPFAHYAAQPHKYGDVAGYRSLPSRGDVLKHFGYCLDHSSVVFRVSYHVLNRFDPTYYTKLISFRFDKWRERVEDPKFVRLTVWIHDSKTSHIPSREQILRLVSEELRSQYQFQGEISVEIDKVL